MSDSESGRKDGGAAGGTPEARTRTARPASVGPHHARDGQEDPADRGVTPEEGYGAEIARNRDAAEQAPDQGPIAPSPATETADESGGTEEMLRRSGARDAPPLTGTTGE